MVSTTPACFLRCSLSRGYNYYSLNKRKLKGFPSQYLNIFPFGLKNFINVEFSNIRTDENPLIQLRFRQTWKRRPTCQVGLLKSITRICQVFNKLFLSICGTCMSSLGKIGMSSLGSCICGMSSLGDMRRYAGCPSLVPLPTAHCLPRLRKG